MAITLRLDSGSALSHAQVDTNFISYFYSASLTGGTLKFFRTGSTALGVPATSSSFSLVTDTYWTSSATNISRLGTVIVSGAFINGLDNVATGLYAHAEGISTAASGDYSHTQGSGSSATKTGAHAEGYQTQGTGPYSHAEGYLSIAQGTYSHAEGSAAVATGTGSHAEGYQSLAAGAYSHAEGYNTISSGYGAHAEGLGTRATGSYQHVQGQYNLQTTEQSAFIVGNGVSDATRSNLIFAAGSTVQITGSLKVTGGITGSLLGTSSYSTTASFVQNAVSSSYPLTVTGSSVYSTYLGGVVPSPHTIGVIAIGGGAGGYTSGSDNSIYLGGQAGYGSPVSPYTNYIGAFAGASAISASDSNFIGFSAGGDTTNAIQSNFFGNRAGRYSINANNSNFFGIEAGNSTSASNSNFIGAYAGKLATDASNSNFFGKYTGWAQTGSSYSTFIGHRVADTTLGPGYLGSNNIIIGTSITLPSGTSNAINLGGVLFGTGTYSNPSVLSSGSVAGGRIGIGTTTPAYTLDVSGSGRFTDNLQVTGSLGVTGSIVLANDRPIYFGSASQASTSSYAIFRDSVNRLTIGNNVQENYGSDGIKIDTSGKIQLNHVSQNYGIYDTTLNIIGSGSNDGITMTQHPDTSNRYTITVESGSSYKMNFRNSLHPASGSFNFSGSVNINEILTLTPRSTTPGTPTNGMVIVSGSGVDQHIYCYLNSTWKQLD